MRLYFVRHGESEANLLHEFSNRGRKHGLTSRGREQALAGRFRGIPIRKLYSSPLLRATQTAQILSFAFEISYETTEALREYDCGILEGKSDDASWALYDRVFDDWTKDNKWARRIEGGESFLDIEARFKPFIDRLIKTYRGLSVNIVMVGHGGLYRCMLPLILVNVDFEFAVAHPLDNTDYVSADVYDRSAVCVEWGPTSLSQR
jgi:broad specificity phosphatase PhoE